MTTIDRSDPPAEPSTPILQVHSELHPRLEAFYSLSSATDAAARHTNHDFIDSFGRLLAVRRAVNTRPSLIVKATSTTEAELLLRVRTALTEAARVATDLEYVPAGFQDKEVLNIHVDALVALQPLSILLAELFLQLNPSEPSLAALDSTEPQPETDPEDKFPRKRMCKVMRTC